MKVSNKIAILVLVCITWTTFVIVLSIHCSIHYYITVVQQQQQEEQEQQNHEFFSSFSSRAALHMNFLRRNSIIINNNNNNNNDDNKSTVINCNDPSVSNVTTTTTTIITEGEGSSNHINHNNNTMAIIIESERTTTTRKDYSNANTTNQTTTIMNKQEEEDNNRTTTPPLPLLPVFNGTIFTNYHVATSSSPPSLPTDNNNTITLVTQLSWNRWNNLVRLASQWKGYITCAVYIQGPYERQLLDEWIQQDKSNNNNNNTTMTTLSKVTIHVYYMEQQQLPGDDDDDDDYPYPINIMRNLALDHTTTDFVLLLDADFFPSNDALSQLQELLQLTSSDDNIHINNTMTWSERLRTRKEVLILPAFEFPSATTTTTTTRTMPMTKQDLLHSILQLNESKPFHTANIEQVRSGGHGPTRYQIWYDLKPITPTTTTQTTTSIQQQQQQPYHIETPAKELLWRYHFEPYILAFRKHLPKFWNGFVGYGKNKSTFFLELEFRKFQFYVVPQTFVIHQNHVYEQGITHYRARQYHPTVQMEFETKFVPYLYQTYTTTTNNTTTKKDENNTTKEQQGALPAATERAIIAPLLSSPLSSSSSS